MLECSLPNQLCIIFIHNIHETFFPCKYLGLRTFPKCVQIEFKRVQIRDFIWWGAGLSGSATKSAQDAQMTKGLFAC